MIGMNDSEFPRIFLSRISDMAIAFLFVIYGYFYEPIELIEKYKSVMPKEVGLLLISTGFLLTVLSITSKTMASYIKNKIYKQNTSSAIPINRIIIMVLIVILSILLFDLNRTSLELAFCIRHDHLFDYFYKNYLIYISFFFLPIFIVSLIYDNFNELRTYFSKFIGK